MTEPLPEWKPPSDHVFHDYILVLERAIINLRHRIRYSEPVAIDEVHNLMDAIHNIPKMLRNYGGWHIVENIDADLARYDRKWINDDQQDRRTSLLDTLENAKAGDFDGLW